MLVDWCIIIIASDMDFHRTVRSICKAEISASVNHIHAERDIICHEKFKLLHCLVFVLVLEIRFTPVSQPARVDLPTEYDFSISVLFSSSFILLQVDTAVNAHI